MILTIFILLFVVKSCLFRNELLFSIRGCNLGSDKGVIINVNCIDVELETLKKLPRITTDLTFIRNEIPFLESGLFKNLSMLRNLSLTDNQIMEISSLAFEGLSEMEKLILSNNRLRKLNPEVFLTSPKLKFIDLSENFFQHLKPLAKALAPLLHLESLILRKNDLLELIEENDLVALKMSPLEELDLSKCKLRSVTQAALVPLQGLKKLLLSTNLLAEDQLKNALFKVSETLETLEIENLNLKAVPTKSLSLLSNTKLKELKLGHNQFSTILTGDFPPLSSLKTLSLNNCSIERMRGFVFANLTSLQTLDLYKNNLGSIPLAVSSLFNLKLLDLARNSNSKEIGENVISQNSFINMTSLETLYLDFLTLPKLTKQMFYGLNKLRILSLRESMISGAEDYCFEFLKNLNSLDLSSNYPFHFTEKLFYGLDNLKNLYLSATADLKSFRPSCFEHVPKLEVLYLSRNGLLNLESLNTLKNLKTLLLSYNEIQSWSEPFISKNNPNLKELSINRNSLNSITPAMIADFSFLKSLDISRNPLSCCNSFDFVEWVKSTKTLQMEAKSFTTCSVTELENQYFDLALFEIEKSEYCIVDEINSGRSVAIICGFFSVVVLSAICIAVGYYFRWYIRYYFYIMRLSFHRMNSGNVKNNFRYDAFISYSHKNRNWLLQQLLPELEDDVSKFHLCLHERNFEIGKEILTNIEESIDNSRRVIFLLSNDFLSSNWCQWEIELADFKLTNSCRESLILILLEQINKRKVSSRLRYLMRTRTYLKWTENEEERISFWDRLKKSLNKAEAKNEEQMQDLYVTNT